MARTSYILIIWGWWCPLCSRPRPWFGIFIMPSHWNNNPQVDVSLHSDTLFWFRANQSLLLLLSREATNTYSLLVQTHVCCTQDEHANCCTTRIRWTEDIQWGSWVFDKKCWWHTFDKVINFTKTKSGYPIFL